MVSDVDKISQQGVLPSGLSDHFIIHCTRKTVKSLLNKHHTTIIRSMKHYSKEMLTELLQTVDWCPCSLKLPRCQWSMDLFSDLFIPIGARTRLCRQIPLDANDFPKGPSCFITERLCTSQLNPREGGGGEWPGDVGLILFSTPKCCPAGWELVERRYRRGHGAGIANTTQILLMQKSYLLV